jgi:hypothetical protein
MPLGIPVVTLRRMTVKPGWARKRPASAITLPTTEKPDWVRAPRPRPLWRLERGEQRVLMITFAGGVASIAAAAFVLGIAIALARFITHGNKHTAALAEVGGVIFAVLVTGMFLAIVAIMLVLASAISPRLSAQAGPLPECGRAWHAPPESPTQCHPQPTPARSRRDRAAASEEGAAKPRFETVAAREPPAA